MRGLDGETPERWEGCPISRDGDLFHFYWYGRVAERHGPFSQDKGEVTPVAHGHKVRAQSVGGTHNRSS
jgi:hypothetical protein